MVGKWRLWWTINVAMKNRASKHVIGAMDHVQAVLPYTLTGFDIDNGGEFSNYDRSPGVKSVTSR